MTNENFTRRTFLVVGGGAALTALTGALDLPFERNEILPSGGCQGKKTSCACPLSDYYSHHKGPRVISPTDYINYLKSTVFTHGELDNLPPLVVILHDSLVEEHLKKLGFTDYRPLQTGTTDPNLMYVVKRSSGKDFILNRGLPGAGGIATQAAELYALGVEQIVHVGTCGLLGPEIKEGVVILSRGSYKDGAAVMLSSLPENQLNLIARPSSTLNSALESRLREERVPFTKATGFTMPIYYFQPADLIRGLMQKTFSGGEKLGYVEMEEAPFFQTAELMGRQAASLVVGSDRYVVNPEGKVVQEYYDVDCNALKTRMLEIAVGSFPGG